MYLPIGADFSVRTSCIIGIFDLETTTVSKHSRKFLEVAEKQKQVINVSYELPKSFIVTECKGKKNVYISQISTSTLQKRSKIL